MLKNNTARNTIKALIQIYGIISENKAKQNKALGLLKKNYINHVLERYGCEGNLTE